MAETIGTITIVHGTATATIHSEVRTLQVGDPVFQDELIITRADSAVEIRFTDETVMAQGANSELLLDVYTFDPATGAGRLSFEMVQGSFRSVTGIIVDQSPENFELGSPMATIGIRGTTTAHTIPPQWSSDPENHVVLVFDGKPVLVMTDASGEIRLIDTSGRKVEISDFGTSQVMVMTVAEYLYYEQLAHDQLQGQEPVWNSPQDVINDNPDTNRPVGEHFNGNLADENYGDENQGDLDGDGDVDEDDAQIAEDTLYETIDSLILEGNGSESLLMGGSLLMDGSSYLLMGSSSSLLLFSGLTSTTGTHTTTLLNLTTTTETLTTASVSGPLSQITVTGGGGTHTLSTEDLSSGFTVTPPSNDATPTTYTFSLPAGTTSLPTGSVTANFSSFGSNQNVQFNGSAITSGGYFNVTTGAGADQVSGTNHNTDGDTINGGEGNDTLKGYYGDDTINGGGGDDTIYGLADTALNNAGGWTDNDTLNGEDGNDTIYGGEGNDTITGGADEDTMYGESGDDTFIISSQNDVTGGELYDGGADADTVQLGGNVDFQHSDTPSTSILTNMEKVQLSAGVTGTFGTGDSGFFTNITDILGADNGLSTVETLAFKLDNGEDITLSSYYSAATFAGNNWGSEDIVQITGSSGGHTITGTDMDEVITGGTGNDTIIPGGGDDTVSGVSGTNTITFQNAGDFTAADSVDGGSGEYDELEFTAEANTTYTFSNVTNVEKVTFLNAGTADVTVITQGNFPMQTEGSTTFDGSALTSAFSLDATAEPYAVMVKAGSGDNTIICGNMNCAVTFTSGGFDATGDTATGGTGTDTLFINANDLDNISSTNVVNFESLNIQGSSEIDSWALSSAMNTITRVQWTSITSTSANTVDLSGATQDMVVYTNNASNNVTLGQGDDYVGGGNANDFFIFGDYYTDDDQVSGSYGTDVLTFNPTQNTTYKFTNVRSLETIAVGDVGSLDSVILQPKANIYPTSGAVITIECVNVTSNVITVDGTVTNDELYVKAGTGGVTFIVDGTIGVGTQFDGSTGDDTLQVNDGADFTGFNYGAYFNDQIDNLVFGASATATFRGANWGDLDTFVTIADAGSSSTETWVLEMEGTMDLSGFAPNFTSWGSEDVIRIEAQDQLTFTDSDLDLNETVVGSSDADTFNMHGGDDTLTGGNGADTFDFSEDATNFDNNDSVTGGDDNETDELIINAGGTYPLANVNGVELITLVGGGDADITMTGSLGISDGSATIDAGAISSLTLNATTETNGLIVKAAATGGDPTTTITGAAGDDTFDFTGTTFDDNDSVNGGNGGDTLKVNAGTLEADLNNITNVETVEFHGTVSNQSWTMAAAVLSGITDFSIDATNMTDGSYSFSIDGTNAAGVNLSITGATGTNNLEGNSGNDFLSGGISADTLKGNDGNDTLTGGDGNDELFGGAGTDTITGGVGSDTITGGTGADTFKYTVIDESGMDTIEDFEYGTDQLSFKWSVFDNTATIINAAIGTINTYGDSDAHFVYDSTTGTLYYDPDGDGSAVTGSVCKLLDSGIPVNQDLTMGTDIVFSA